MSTYIFTYINHIISLYTYVKKRYFFVNQYSLNNLWAENMCKCLVQNLYELKQNNVYLYSYTNICIYLQYYQETYEL